jgi:hypothetical protein
MPGPGRRFTAGNNANPNGRRGKPEPEPVFDEEPVPEAPVPQGEPEPSAVLRDLHWAYRNFGVRCKGTPQQMAFREMLEGDRPKFMDLMTKHEQMHEAKIKRFGPSSGPEKAVEAEEVEDDPGTIAALSLVEKILKEVGEDSEMTALREENLRLRRQVEAAGLGR